MSLRVVRPEGARPLVRRSGLRRFGVPEGGPFDTVSARLANALVGRESGSSVYELTLFGGVFVAEADLVVGVVGAPCRVWIGETAIGGDRSFFVSKGSSLRVAGTAVGARVYVAYRAASEGGPDAGRARLAEPAPSLSAGPLRLLPGPAADLVATTDLAAAEWTVSLDSDRVGLRCTGPRLGEGIELTSEPACPGAVQLTPSGTLLISGPDGPTLGGYPKIGVVASVDLARLGQRGPGDTIRFEPVSLEEARLALSERDAALATLERAIGWRAGWK